MTEVRGQRLEGRTQRTDVRGQKREAFEFGSGRSECGSGSVEVGI